MILKEYIRCCIKENSGYSKLNDIIKSLNSKVSDYENSIDESKLWDILIENVENLGLVRVGSGLQRKVYSLPGENWVLKIAYGRNNTDYRKSLESNEEEVRISEGGHGMGARDLFVKVLGSDKLSDLPTWIITEKVIVLRVAEDYFSLSDMEKIFPTFFSLLNKNSKVFDEVYTFCDFVSNVFTYLGRQDVPGSNYKGLSKERFYKIVSLSAPYGEKITEFNKVTFGEDYNKIIRACAYNRPGDIHDGNLGIINSGNPSPRDIVILDYMIIK